jgi:hypothetical protein
MNALTAMFRNCRTIEREDYQIFAVEIKRLNTRVKVGKKSPRGVQRNHSTAQTMLFYHSKKCPKNDKRGCGRIFLRV